MPSCLRGATSAGEPLDGDTVEGWHAVTGELHFRLGQHSAAERAWREALRWASASTDQEFLRRRLADCRRFLGLAPDPNS